MAISGYIGAGAQEALDAVLQRRLQEHTRRLQEQAQAENIAQERQRINLAQRAQASLEQERAEDRAFRQGQTERADASQLAQDIEPGPTTPDVAAALRKHPGIAPRVTERKIIDARPIAGTAPLDASGPQQFDVFEPTRAQAEQKRKTVLLQEIGKQLATAPNEQQRRAVGAQAFGEGLDVPNNLLDATEGERLAQKLADEKRDEDRWNRQNATTFRQQQALTSQRASAGSGNKGPASTYGQRQQSDIVRKIDDLIGREDDPSTPDVNESRPNRITGKTAGVAGTAISKLPWNTEARDVSAELQSLAANLAFSQLQQMREASKTGGALGAVSERELDLLQNAMASIRQDQSPENLIEQLTIIRESITRFDDAVAQYGGIAPMAPVRSHGGGNTAPRRRSPADLVKQYGGG